MSTHISHDAAGESLWAVDAAAEFVADPLDGDLVADLCVVGLGGTGLAAVEAGLAHDMSVVGVDAAGIAGAAAGRNGGLLLAGMAPFHHGAVDQYGRDRATAWYRATIAERDRLLDADDVACRRTGSLRVAADADEQPDLQVMFDAMQRDGLDVAHTDTPHGPALLFPGDGACNPWLRCQRLARRMVADGAVLATHSPVVGIDTAEAAATTSGATLPGGTSPAVVVHTPKGDVHSRHVVVAVDGGLERLVPGLAGRVRPVRLQMAATGPMLEDLGPPVYTRHGYQWWQQLPDGRVALGGGRDQHRTAEETDDPRPTEPVQDGLTEMAATLAPSAPITHRWAAVVGYTDDGLPACDEVAPGVWALGGYSGTGNVIGPLLAGLVVRGMAGGDVTAQAAALGVSLPSPRA